LSQRGFELANGLPFVASDLAIHDLLDAHTVQEAETLQLGLGLLRRARGHFQGRLLAIDPQRKRSYSKRQMPRYREDETSKPFKAAQSFFSLDAETGQPVCFTSTPTVVAVSQAAPRLLKMTADILCPRDGEALLLADTEHYTAELFDHVSADTPFDILAPTHLTKDMEKRLREIPDQDFHRHWAGYATLQRPYQPQNSKGGPYSQFVQRAGERPETYEYKAFLCTRQRPEVDALTLDFPQRWHVEEFFNINQELGWKRAGTRNLHIRYAQNTTALIAQAALHQLRERLGKPYSQWSAKHLAHELLRGLNGDIRVQGDTILVTYYNAPSPELLSAQYQGLPQKLEKEIGDPRIPWLYDFKLDFRFK